MGVLVATCSVIGPFYRPPDPLRPERYQLFAVEVEVDQGEARAQPMMVLGDTQVAHLVEAEDALEHPERMFDLGPHPRFPPVLLLL